MRRPNHALGEPMLQNTFPSPPRGSRCRGKALTLLFSLLMALSLAAFLGAKPHSGGGQQHLAVKEPGLSMASPWTASWWSRRPAAAGPAAAARQPLTRSAFGPLSEPSRAEGMGPRREAMSRTQALHQRFPSQQSFIAPAERDTGRVSSSRAGLASKRRYEVYQMDGASEFSGRGFQQGSKGSGDTVVTAFAPFGSRGALQGRLAAPRKSIPRPRSTFMISDKDLQTAARDVQVFAMSQRAQTAEAPVGIAHPAFEVVEGGDVSEYGVAYTMFKHIKTGTEVLSMSNDDDNKVFGIAFRTPVSDSTGVPHILEHSVLCGSRKYPVKDPFVIMLRSSLQTFLNAMTFPDRTLYPVASQNLQDFYNLANVYLDAVLHPRAMEDPMVLQQEGWHFELGNTTDPLIYKGVVYNEMKGVYSSPDSRLQRATMAGLFPDTTYRHDSGGTPDQITSLTFSDFKAFWEKHYHPSNARVYFYGDDPVEARLTLLDSYLSEFEAAPAAAESTRIETQKKWSEPRRIVEKFPVSAEQAAEGDAAKNMVSVNWLLNEEVVPPTEVMALEVMNHLLLGTSSSTLYKALTESKLGSQVIGGGVADYLKQMVFSAGMKGVDEANMPKVEELIHSTLKKVSTEGFEEDAIEAAMNTIEFGMREFSSSSSARGLSFLFNAMTPWIYERDPLSGLRFEAPLAELKSQLAQPGQQVFQELVKKYLVENKAQLTSEGVPDPELAAKEEAAEVETLSAKKKSLSDAALQSLISESKTLQETQAAPDTPEALATVPALSLADLDRKAKDLDITIGQKQGLEFVTHEVDSNGIAYVDVLFDLSVLPVEDVPLLPLFTSMMFDVGTSDLSQTAYSRQIGARTGGLSASTLNSLKNGPDGAIGSPDDVVYKLVVSGKATAEKTGDLLELMLAGLTDAKLDSQDRAVEILKSVKASYDSALSTSGNSFAQKRMMARRSLAGYLDEISGGTTYYETLKVLLAQAEGDWQSLLSRLQSLRAHILSQRDKVIINLSADKKTLAAADGDLDKFALELPLQVTLDSKLTGPTVADAMRGEPKLRLAAENEGFVVSTAVNYVVKGGALYSQGDRISGAATVVQRSLSRGYLWDTVRVLGGAYGGSCSLSMLSGTFLCSSYRDPNILSTIQAYDSMADHLEERALNPKEIEQLIIGAVGDLDGPMSPEDKGWTSFVRYLTGSTLAMRQQNRDEMCATTAEDFTAFAKRLRASAASWRLSIFGSETAFTEAQLDDIKLKQIT